MDVLSDVLRVVRLSGAVFFTAEFTAPFSVDSPPPESLAPSVIPGAGCLSLFHILAEGECWVRVERRPALKMESGDVIVLPRGDPHRMMSGLGAVPTPIPDLLPAPHEGPAHVCFGGGGPKARFVCGYLHCDLGFNPLFGALPPLLCVRNREGAVTVEPVGEKNSAEAPVPLHAGIWLNTTLYYLVTEASTLKSGNAAVLARLSELMFVEILRHYMQEMPAGQKGWLAGLRDPQVGKALELMHAEPARNWAVEELAREVGVSRSALADRFASLMGESPMRYLAAWRMHLAKQMLLEGRLSLAEIAERIGYDSEYAFNRAFKRHAGDPPAAWRKTARQAASAERGPA